MYFKRAWALAAGLTALPLSGAGSGDPVSAPAVQSPAAGVQKAAGAALKSPVRSRRLRFKSGPVCMCTGGLRESDIQKAERERQRAPVPASIGANKQEGRSTK